VFLWEVNFEDFQNNEMDLRTRNRLLSLYDALNSSTVEVEIKK